jgi:ABC-type bacteriocin/lantibiotic exporter with double-glycine peptidase domain
MKIVKQYNNYACVLACLESYLSDYGIQVAQKELLTNYPQHCHVGEDIEGTFRVCAESLLEIGRDYGFTAEFTTAYEPAANRDYFIITLAHGMHCVRVRQYCGNHKFEVMDPNINRSNDMLEYSSFDFQKEQHRSPLFLRLVRSA